MCLGFGEPVSGLEVRFTSPAEPAITATEGYVLLGWALVDTNAVADVEFEVEQSISEDFTEASIRYRGKDLTTYVSGLPSGAFHYRVRAIGVNGGPGPWSVPVHVDVEYVGFRTVIILCSVGVVALVAVLVSVIRGHRRFAGGDAR